MEKVAIITGSSSGLGLSVCEVLLSKGYKVYGWDVNPSPLKSPKFTFQQVDVSNSSSITSALSQVLVNSPSIDVVVNAAGIVIFEPTITDSTVHGLESFERLLKINLIGSFDVTRQVSKYMNKGVIILVSSIGAVQGTRLISAYAASKSALSSMALPLSRDLASRGTRVVSIAPGTFITPMTKDLGNEAGSPMLKAISSGRVGQPPEFSNAVVFAIENNYLNGCSLELNGGLVVPNI